MRQSFIVATFLFVIAGVATVALSQFITSKEEQKIRAQSAIWNSSFKEHDTKALLAILAGDVQMASAGGKWRGHEGSEQFLRALFSKRADITWINTPEKIEINPQWKVAYEFGTWVEAWSEADGRAEIHGNYFAMWKKKDKNDAEPWLLHAAIFTPLRCVGESHYCQ